jgi:hypothetical protein
VTAPAASSGSTFGKPTTPGFGQASGSTFGKPSTPGSGQASSGSTICCAPRTRLTRPHPTDTAKRATSTNL